jgi:type I restriction enzyme M protein
MIDLIDPSESEPLLDPACGTGGFLVGALDYLLDRLRAEQSVPSPLADELAERIRQYATSSLFGCDFDPFLIRASQMNMVMAGDGKSHLYHLNSLEFPTGHLPDVSRADRDIPLGTAHIIVTNPPFGADIPITDPAILRQYDLAHRWVETPSGFQRTKELQKTVAPEILFVERCLQWLRPGGRAAIVLPDGVLGNPALKYVRAWLLEHAWIIASVDLPVEAFIAEANVNILTSILLLRKKDPTLRMGDCPSSYPVFMAVAENVGVDRRGNPLFRRNAAGDELLETVEEVVSLGPGRPSRRVVKRVRVPDDDLPAIALAFREWRASAAHGNPHLIYGNLNSHI